MVCVSQLAFIRAHTHYLKHSSPDEHRGSDGEDEVGALSLHLTVQQGEGSLHGHGGGVQEGFTHTAWSVLANSNCVRTSSLVCSTSHPTPTLRNGPHAQTNCAGRPWAQHSHNASRRPIHRAHGAATWSPRSHRGVSQQPGSRWLGTWHGPAVSEYAGPAAAAWLQTGHCSEQCWSSPPR